MLAEGELTFVEDNTIGYQAIVDSPVAEPSLGKPVCYLDRDPELLLKLPSQRIRGAFAFFSFAAGELPAAAVRAARHSPGKQQLSAAPGDTRNRDAQNGGSGTSEKQHAVQEKVQNADENAHRAEGRAVLAKDVVDGFHKG